MGDIGQGVGQLAVGERTAGPVGEAAGLVELDLQHLADQGVIGDLLAETRRHPGDLGVEQRPGHGAQVVEDLDVLTGGVEDLEHGLVAQDVEKRIELQVLGQGIDTGLGAIGRGHLDEAKLGPVGRLAHELGVHGDKGLAFQGLAEFRQFGGGRNRLHRVAIAPRGAESARGKAISAAFSYRNSSRSPP